MAPISNAPLNLTRVNTINSRISELERIYIAQEDSKIAIVASFSSLLSGARKAENAISAIFDAHRWCTAYQFHGRYNQNAQNTLYELEARCSLEFGIDWFYPEQELKRDKNLTSGHPEEAIRSLCITNTGRWVKAPIDNADDLFHCFASKLEGAGLIAEEHQVEVLHIPMSSLFDRLPSPRLEIRYVPASRQ